MSSYINFHAPHLEISLIPSNEEDNSDIFESKKRLVSFFHYTLPDVEVHDETWYHSQETDIYGDVVASYLVANLDGVNGLMSIQRDHSQEGEATHIQVC